MIRRQMKTLRATFKRHRKNVIAQAKQLNHISKLHPEHHKFTVDTVKSQYPELFERRK